MPSTRFHVDVLTSATNLPFGCARMMSFSAAHDTGACSVCPMRCQWGSNPSPTSPPAGRRQLVFVEWQAGSHVWRSTKQCRWVCRAAAASAGCRWCLCKQRSCTIAHALGRMVEPCQTTKIQVDPRYLCQGAGISTKTFGISSLVDPGPAERWSEARPSRVGPGQPFDPGGREHRPHGHGAGAVCR